MLSFVVPDSTTAPGDAPLAQTRSFICRVHATALLLANAELCVCVCACLCVHLYMISLRAACSAFRHRINQTRRFPAHS